MAEWLSSLRHRLNALLRRRQLEQDLHDELAFHLAMREEQLRRSGAVDPRVGARRRFGERLTVMRMVIGEGARLVSVGLVIGLLGGLAVSRLVASLLYQTGSFDPLVFAIVPGVLGSVAFLACALPAWHATRVEPVSALRTE